MNDLLNAVTKGNRKRINYGSSINSALSSWGTSELKKINHGGLKNWDEKIASEFYNLTKTINGLEILLDDDYFLNLGDSIFEAHREDIYDFWEQKYINNKDINLVIFIEGIGSGKSSKFSIMQWLQWFELSVRCDIEKFYHTMPGEITAFISMSRSEVQARKVVMNKVMSRFNTQFNREYFPPNPRKGQEIFIERNNTSIFAGTSSAASSLGYNIYGGAVDEANFLQVKEDSARNRGKERYDAAEEMYNHMMGRIKSRFINPYTGLVDGTLFMFSSARYPDDFLEKKAREKFNLGENSKIYISRKSVWDARPKWYYSGITFNFDISQKKVLESEEKLQNLIKSAEIAKLSNQPKLISQEEKDAKQEERRKKANWYPYG